MISYVQYSIEHTGYRMHEDGGAVSVPRGTVVGGGPEIGSGSRVDFLL